MSTHDVEQRLAQLAGRVDKLEEENHRLRAALQAAEGGDGPVNRRQLLTGGAGWLGALAGGALLAGGGTAQAADGAGFGVVHDDGAATVRLARPTVVALAVTLPPRRGGGQHWARYTWPLGAHFSTPRRPVVVAAAQDNHHGVGTAAAPTCAVAVEGTPGAYQAVIMVNNLGLWATEVTLNAVAIGE